jgi:putative tryptophan/tyrosine transport system substrate-binding protein
VNNRRAFVIALLAMIGCSQREEPKQVAERASPTTQPSRITRVVILYFSSGSLGTNVFRQRLSELGYIDGKTILIEERFADGDTQRLTQLARDLAASKVDVIVTPGVAATMAARQATSTIPIVMVHAGSEPSLVSAGLIASLAHPGGNVTGSTNAPLQGKNVDLIRELVPRVARIAILVNPTNAGAAEDVKAATEAASKAGIGVVVAEVTQAEDFSKAFATIHSAHPDGLIVAVDPLIGTHSTEVIQFAATSRLPAIYDFGGMARQGGLIAYAIKYNEHYPIAAEYVDKILKGADPADLPVQQPARFELVINRKTANALGLAIPRDLLLRADEVIE